MTEDFQQVFFLFLSFEETVQQYANLELCRAMRAAFALNSSEVSVK